MKKVIVITVLIAIAVIYYGYTLYAARQTEVASQELNLEEIEEIVPVVSATGTVLPAEWAKLSFPIGGWLEELAVEVGDEVTAGQFLARLDATDLEHALAQAQTTLTTAEAQLAQVQAGARPEEISAAEGSVRAAEAALAAARADWSTSLAEWAAALAGVAVAQAELEQVQAGPKDEEIATAKATMMKAADALELAQEEYDKIAWQEGIGATAQALTLQEATLDYEAARANYEALARGATAEELAIAQAGVDEARARVKVARARVDAARATIEGAEAGVAQAQAELALLKAGASPEEVAVAEARVAEARAALDRARAAMEDARLTAPLSGIVADIAVREGETVSASQFILALGDVSHLRVETTDLNEIDIAKVKVGQRVSLTFDALPERVIGGRVTSIAPRATIGQGGTNYTVTIELDELDPDLRWGMTAFVDITVE
ncbi:MAG: HlyD family secretion protein [Anaerolineae bacterium]